MFLRFRKKRSDSILHDLDDHDLIGKYLESGEGEIIAVLFIRYTHLVYGVCLKYLKDTDDARDAVMEIFESLPEKLLRHEIRNFKSWLHSVSRNHCLMKLRHIMPLEVLKDPADIKGDGENMEFDLAEHQENEEGGFSHEEVTEALKSLKEPQRQCIEMVYLDGKSYQQVCEITGYTYGEVKSHLQNGKRNLKIRLESYHEK